MKLTVQESNFKPGYFAIITEYQHGFHVGETVELIEISEIYEDPERVVEWKVKNGEEIWFQTEEGMKVVDKITLEITSELVEALLIMFEDNGYDIDGPIEGYSARTQKVINAYRKATGK